ncbi:hypothetical protein [Sporolactobacillus shoreae]|nr:hypothetical protein [Sporolactobacillus shoreae]
MTRRRWILLFRVEEREKVWWYETLQRHDLNAWLRDRWEPVKDKNC